MQLIIGLGNPGKEYQKNRHNLGFMVLDNFLKDLKFQYQEKFHAVLSEAPNYPKTFFVYPLTFMNDSGKAVKEILEFYKLTLKDILIIHDDVDLPLGTIKFTENSGAAGHNGVKSIIDSLGSQEFRRIRIGVESRDDKSQMPTDAFVLQNFSDAELAKIPFDEIKARLRLELKTRSDLNPGSQPRI